jgi:molybdate transport system substrate-binding protein
VFKKINYLLISFLAPLIGLISCAPKNEPVLKVAVATNFLTTADTLVEVFKRSTGIEVLLISGSSGQLATQVINGAPYDIFLSADDVYPSKLSSLGFADAQTQLTYALGQLVLYGAGDVEQNLKSGNFYKLALANPKVAPYGLAADRVINNLNIRSNVEGRTVYGQNVGQVY